MNKATKTLLNKAAGHPNQTKKDMFIRQHRKMYSKPTETTVKFILSQLPQICWYVWAFSAAVILLAIIGVMTKTGKTAVIVSALMPFVSMLGVLEEFRSKQHGMVELESVTNVSFRGLYFAKVSCIGAVHLAVLVLLTMLLGSASKSGYLVTGAQITIPYLTAAVINTKIARTQFGRKNIFACLAVSVLVSVLAAALTGQTKLDETLPPLVWVVVPAVLLIAECYEIRGTIKEIYVWK